VALVVATTTSCTHDTVGCRQPVSQKELRGQLVDGARQRVGCKRGVGEVT
jgi:hypothetical protein